MNMMSDSMSGLRDSQEFVNAVTNLSNPVLGILAGTVFTAIIQSSSASVGILQALAMSGAISLSSSVYVLFGQNIGTCITAVLASVGTSRNARRTTVIHLLFNITGTIIFTIICMLTPFTDFIQSLTPDNPAAQIANVHTIFNIVTTLILLPFGTLLEKAAMKILPERSDEKSDKMQLRFISPDSVNNHSIGSVSVAVSQIQSEVSHMLELARSNVSDAFDNILHWDRDRFENVEKNEEYVDFLNAEISKYISALMSGEMTEQDAKTVSAYFKIIGNIERISDHAMNIAEYAMLLNKKGYKADDEIYSEVEEMKYVTLDGLKLIDFSAGEMQQMTFVSVSMAEKNIDSLSEAYRSNQIERLRENKCSGDVSVVYSEMITDFERIGDHLLNIGELMTDKK